MKVPDANISANQTISSNQLQDIAKTGATETRSAKTSTVKTLAVESPAGQGAAAPKAQNDGLGRPDSVQISTLSSKINELQSGSPEREAYLERLAASYAAGEYNADPDAIAAKLVDNALEAEVPGLQQSASAGSPVVDAYRKNM